jgi:hypothetical protein
MALSKPGNTLPWIEMPVVDEPGMVMRWIIDTGMQRGIAGEDARSHVWTAYTDRKAFLRSCGIDSVNDIYVLVVTGDGEIVVAVGASDRLGWVEVADRGPGFGGDAEPLFEKFARGQAGDGRPPGTGLGLALARAFLRAMQGDVSACDREGGGAVVRLMAPLA